MGVSLTLPLSRNRLGEPRAEADPELDPELECIPPETEPEPDLVLVERDTEPEPEPVDRLDATDESSGMALTLWRRLESGLRELFRVLMMM